VARGAGPCAARSRPVTAGWQEREPDDAELDALLDGRSVNLRLHARWLDVLERDPEYAAAEREHRAALAERRSCTSCSSTGCSGAARGGRRGSGRPRCGSRARRRRGVVRLVDERHLPGCARPAPRSRRVAARGAAAVAGTGRGAGAAGRGAALVRRGRHVGVLLHVLRLFAVTRAAGRDRLVRRGDGVDRARAAVPRPAAARPVARRVRRRGLGWLPGCVLLPHARRRLRDRRPARMAELAVRAAPARVRVLDDGVRLDLGPAARCRRTRGRRGRRPDRRGGRRGERAGRSTGCKERSPDAAAVDRFLARHQVPIVEGDRCTFLWRGEADAVHLVQRIVGLPDRMPLRRIWAPTCGTWCWSCPRLAGQLPARGAPRRARRDAATTRSTRRSPTARSARRRCASRTATPPRTGPSPTRRPPGELTEMRVPSRALRRDCRVSAVPAGPRSGARRYPLLVVHDGGDFLQYAAAKTVLDNLIHRLDVAEIVVAFVHRRTGWRVRRLAAHARFLPRAACRSWRPSCRWSASRSGRCLLGSSFGAVAALSAAYRAPDTTARWR
jgi:hypothetical protein